MGSDPDKQLPEPEPDPVLPNGAAKRRKDPAGAAFDIWLQRGLHRMYDDIAQEPIPEELLRLIDQDRSG